MDRHHLTQEFPEFVEKINELKTKDASFNSLYEEYETLEDKIYKINTDEEVVIDEYAHELKAKLLNLKDEIYSILRK